jgi:hypothetical protein
MLCLILLLNNYNRNPIQFIFYSKTQIENFIVSVKLVFIWKKEAMSIDSHANEFEAYFHLDTKTLK